MKPLRLTPLAALLALAFASPAQAVGLDDFLSNKPLSTDSTGHVATNFFMIFDNSGSMGEEFMPDNLTANGVNARCRRSYQVNTIYFNPNVTYRPPVDHAGNPTALPLPSFTHARVDGYQPETGGGAPNSGNNPWYDLTSLNPQSASPTTKNSFCVGQNDPVANPNCRAWYTRPRPGVPTGPGVCRPDSNYEVIPVPPEQQQNYANWFTYYRTRMLMMKTSMTHAFTPLDTRFRLGYMQYWAATLNSAGNQFMNMALATNTPGGGRDLFYRQFLNAAPSSNTPSRWALSVAGRYFAGLSGRPDPIEYSCQRNMVLLVTDGMWNTANPSPNFGCRANSCNLNLAGWDSVGNADRWAPAPYGGANAVETLADVAYYYYNTDLRPPGTPNSEDNVFLSPSLGDTNKKQHINTFTLGLGVNGSLRYTYPYQLSSPEQADPTNCSASATNCDYGRIVAGTLNWPIPSSDNVNNIDDLWHAAVNGRGLYMSAKDTEQVQGGLDAIIRALSHQGSASGAASSGLPPVQGELSYVFKPEFKTEAWTGDIKKVVSSSAAEVWSAQALLDAKSPAARKIYMAKKENAASVLVDFNAANLATPIANKWFNAGPDNPNGPLAQYSSFSANQRAAATPESLIDYLRGARNLEDSNNALSSQDVAKLYRGREHVLGDIVNTTPVYVEGAAFEYHRRANGVGYEAFATSVANRRKLLYVGANDGMLHAFDARTGEEVWAFVPTAVLPHLHKLANKSYSGNHRFYVDGPITVTDVDFADTSESDTQAGKNWHTVLVGGLGKGGRAYYALDITQPEEPKLLWEFAASSEGTTDNTWVDANLGHSYGNAKAIKLQKPGCDGAVAAGCWKVILASGYYNTGGDSKGRLYVLDAKTGTKDAEITTTGGTDPEKSGMAWVTSWVKHTMEDPVGKHAYAGDLGGRVWRFDIVAKTATLLTTLKNSAGEGQSITTRPELSVWRGGTGPDTCGGGKDKRKRVLYVGTGRYLGVGDLTSQDPQSFYAIRDTLDEACTPVSSDVGGTPGFRSVAPRLFSSGSITDATPPTADPAVVSNAYGWYVDLATYSNKPSERIFTHPQISADARWITVVGNSPAADLCSIGGTGKRYIWPTQSGTARPLYADNGAMIMGLGWVLRRDTTGKLIRKELLTGSDGGVYEVDGPPSPQMDTQGGHSPRRVNWRELKN